MKFLWKTLKWKMIRGHQKLMLHVLDCAMSSKSKKRRLAENDELGNVIPQSFDNVSKAIEKATKVLARCFSKSYGAEVHAALGVLDLDPISKTEAYIFLIENPTYKEMFFGCPDHERKCVLLTLMSRPKN